jgi:hypothetical protein
MDTYVYECVHRYDPTDHNHGDNYMLIEPGDHLEAQVPQPFAIEGTMEEPKVSISIDYK